MRNGYCIIHKARKQSQFSKLKFNGIDYNKVDEDTYSKLQEFIRIFGHLISLDKIYCKLCTPDYKFKDIIKYIEK